MPDVGAVGGAFSGGNFPTGSPSPSPLCAKPPPELNPNAAVAASASVASKRFISFLSAVPGAFCPERMRHHKRTAAATAAVVGARLVESRLDALLLLSCEREYVGRRELPGESVRHHRRDQVP